MNVAGSRRLVGLFVCARRRAGADGLFRRPGAGSAAGRHATAAATGGAAGAHAARRHQAVRPRHHQGGEVGRRHFHRASHRRQAVLRDSESPVEHRVSLGEPDRPDGDRRRPGWPGGGQPGREMGAAQQSRLPAQRLVRHRRRSLAADRAGGRGREQRRDPDGVQRRGGRDGRRAGDRGHAPVHHRGARVQRPGPRAVANVRRQPIVHRARRLVPRKHRGRGDPHLLDRAPDPERAAGEPAERRPAGQRDGRHALQHGEAAREADDAAAVRRAGRLLQRPADGLRPGRASRAEAALHRPLAAREEGSERGAVRAGEADRLLHRPGDADQVGAVPQARRRELAGSVRGGGLQERDSGEGRARRRSRTPTGVRKTPATR